ncbi:histamine N-methyltransferase-like isoform X2 [Ptychodera flava]|uniref:histamine N-methyltransferase-like isoform X2 n=1 Tax=Ptychodera flava TaxID=63121 RepID=UPI00396A51F3
MVRGTKDIPIIDALLRRVEIVNYVVIEPSESEINKFKEFVSSKQDNGEWQNVRFTFYQVALQTYLRKAIEAGEKTCFDIILALHCAYFFTDPGQTFVDLYELLKNGGTLFNIMCAGAWEKLLKEVERHVGRRAAPCYGSIELRGILQQRMPALKMKILQRKDDVEVDECFKEDSKDGNEILDFILQIVDVRKNVPKDVVDELLLYLREQCCRTVDGKLYFESGDEDIVIVKE